MSEEDETLPTELTNESRVDSEDAVAEIPPETEENLVESTSTQVLVENTTESIIEPIESISGDEPLVPPELEKNVSFASQEGDEGQHLDATLEGIHEDPDMGSLESDIYEPFQFEAQEEFENIDEAKSFANIVFSEDRVHPLPLTARLITSPIPMDLLKKADGFEFVNATYEADPDELYFGLATAMSRSGSVEALAREEEEAIQAALKEHPEEQETTIVHESIPFDEKFKDLMASLRPSSPTFNSVPEALEQAVKLEETVEEARIQTAEETSQVVDVSLVQEPVVVSDQAMDREALIVAIKKSLEAKERLSQRNLVLQNKLGEYFKKKRTDEARDGEKSVSDQEQRYANCMSSLNELRGQYEEINSNNQKVVGEYKAKLEERKEEVHSKVDEFFKYKRQIALSAENSRTGKGIPVKVVDQLETLEKKKEHEVVTVRLENIKLRNKLKRHEQLLRQKEELADGLHLIDFEQLKIENQTYNEKIEERNEELLKLRKKITNVVQVLTHVKEKLQFVQGETVELTSELKGLESQVTQRRDSLPVAKQQRDALRSTNTSLRQTHGLLGNNRLLRDYGEKDESKGLRGRIDEMKQYYQGLVDETVRLRRKLQKAQLVASLSNEHIPSF